MPNFTIGPWHFKEQGRSRLFSSYICYAGQTLHEGNSCTTGLCLGKASSHRRCITKHSRTGTRHNSDSTGNVSHGFPTCGPRQLRALTLEKELCQRCQQQGWRVGRCSVQRVLRCEHFLKAFGQGVIPRVANIRNLQTGQLTALRRWERVKSRQTSSDSAKMKTTCEDRPLPLATWLRSANRTASRTRFDRFSLARYRTEDRVYRLHTRAMGL